jgi:hypothetical protein
VVFEASKEIGLDGASANLGDATNALKTSESTVAAFYCLSFNLVRHEKPSANSDQPTVRIIMGIMGRYRICRQPPISRHYCVQYFVAVILLFSAGTYLRCTGVLRGGGNSLNTHYLVVPKEDGNERITTIIRGGLSL